MPAVPWAQWNCLEQNKSVASMCKVMVNKMGVYLKKKPTLKQNKKKQHLREAISRLWDDRFILQQMNAAQ